MPAGLPRRRSVTLPSLSVRLRLTLWYGLVLALTVLLVGGLVYVILSQVLLSEVDRSISDRGDEVASAVRVGVVSPTEMRIALPQPNDYASADIFVQITDLDGTVLATSDNLGTLNLPVNPSALSGARNGLRGFETLDAGAVRLRVFYAPLTLAGHVVAVTQVARPLILQDRILAGLRAILAVGITLSVLISAVVGSLLARAALRPIDQITTTAEEIGQARDFARGRPAASRGPVRPPVRPGFREATDLRPRRRRSRGRAGPR